MRLPSRFELERQMAKYEFRAEHPLCLSDCEPLTLSEALALADDDCKRRWTDLSLGYTDSDGHPALRQEIAGLYTQVQHDDILVLVPQEAIQIAARAMLRPGDHVVCVRPAYQSLYEHALALGCDVSFWRPGLNDTGRFYFSIDALRLLLRPDTRAVFVNFPHNPTGALPSLSEWREVVACCEAVGAYLFSDEMYRGLELGGSDQLPAAADCYDRGISLCGMSKSLGMPGIRLGWLALRDRALFQQLQLLHDYYSICHAAPSEILAIIGLRNRQRLIAENVALIEENLGRAKDFFDRHAQIFDFPAPRGSTIAFPRLRTGEAVDTFCERLVSESGVFLLPGTAYDGAGGAAKADGRFRIGLGRRDFARGLARLDAWLARGGASLAVADSRIRECEESAPAERQLCRKRLDSATPGNIKAAMQQLISTAIERGEGYFRKR